MRDKRLSFTMLLCLIIFSLASTPQRVRCAKTVEIGVIAPSGVNEYAAIISIANDDINDYMASKGLDYSFTYFLEDAEGQAEVHLEHIKSFRSMGVDLLIGGGWSSHAQASLSYINDNDMLLFSPSSTVLDLSIPDDNLFRLTPSDRWYTQARADVVRSWGIDAAIVIYRDDTWGASIYDQLVGDFAALGGEVVEGYGYEPGTSDFHDLVSEAEVKANELAEEYGREQVGLLLDSTLQDCENIILEAKNFPIIYNLKWFSVRGQRRPQYVIDTMPSEAEHLKLFSVDQHVQDTSKARDVEDRFVSMIGMPFNVYTANLYDICWIYALSVFTTDSVDASTIKNVLPDIAAGYNGITGNCELDGNGDRVPSIFDVWGVGEIEGRIQLLKYAYYDHSTQETVWDTSLIDVEVPTIPPVAVINGPYSGEEDTSISFSSAGSHDPDGDIVDYRWDFGDGQTSASADPSYTYEEPGDYTVTLRVTDNQGATDTATTTCTVEEVLPPDDGKDGFPWLPVLAVLVVVAVAAAYLYMQKMKARVKVLRPVGFDVVVEPEEIPADGRSTAIITIGLLDDEGKPIAAVGDMAVTVSASGGVVVSSSEVKRDEATGVATITDSVRQAIESLLTRREEGGMRVSIKEGESGTEAALVSSLEVGSVSLSVSAPGMRRRTVRVRFSEKRRYCMHCGASMSIGDRRCPKCGLTPPSGVDVKRCPNCGEVNPSVARFCSECGAGQPRLE
jgi:branched-chain amino acid transport system substrate-binding protein